MVSQASRLRDVRYDIRGPVLRRARQLEAEGHQILKLNLGNPAPFGLFAPDAVVRDVVQNIGDAQGYSDARGIHAGRLAVAQHFERQGRHRRHAGRRLPGQRRVRADRDGAAGPAGHRRRGARSQPRLPAVDRRGRTCAAAARCTTAATEQEDWAPDLEHVADADHAAAPGPWCIINPNNPTGAVYSRETLLGLLDLARRHGLLVLTDEIYDQILYEDAVHQSAAALAPDLLVLTLGGLSKTYRLAGFRSGWLVVSGPRARGRRVPGGPGTAGQHAAVRERARAVRDRARARRPAQHRRAAASPAAGCASSATTPGSR